MSTAAEVGETLRDKAMDARGRLDEHVHQARDRVEVVLHRHPIESVLVSSGFGFLLGFVLGFLARGRDD